ncbi:MAG: phosphoribosylanthranilate isomerase [Bacteroidota bacterium]
MKQAANIAAVAALQPDYMGFIFYPKSPRCISEVSAELIKYVPSSIKTTGVFVNEALETVKVFIDKYALKAVQLHGNESEDYCAALKTKGVEIIKAFGVTKNFDFSLLETYLNTVDELLFDTQTPDYGGSGKRFDWTLLNEYPFEKPYFLSGGIDLDDVTAIREIKDTRLYAIDVNSKFEVEPGFKVVEKLKVFKEQL